MLTWYILCDIIESAGAGHTSYSGILMNVNNCRQYRLHKASRNPTYKQMDTSREHSNQIDEIYELVFYQW